ncbi:MULTISPECIES: GntR family transcriptional regulator [unclassified Mycolicibacterium]|uniref:GntR family transcriptional regulator n=1 Tax=unclassified Mycolicibacterium TaxID=2636767 RepID=UPI00192E6562|nr:MULTISPECIES: GntR family transcriptional regulator [unclassified Mycolicibacterium]
MAIAGTPGSGVRYRKLAAELGEAITSGAFGVDARLPSEEVLAARYGVSRGTVRQALSLLRAQGMITSRRGTRRVIIDTAPAQSFVELLSFTRWAQSMGETPGARTLQVARRAATPVEAGQLQLELDAEVVHVVRLRTLSRMPVMIERTTYPGQIGAALADLDADAPSHLDPLVAAGVVLTDAEHTVDVVVADAEDAGALGCGQGAPLLRERRRSSDPTGVPIVWSDDRFLPGTVSFTVHNSVSMTPLTRRRM